MLNFYMVEPEEFDYYEYDSFVVLAKNKEEALKIVLERIKSEWYPLYHNFKTGVTVELIEADKPGIVLGSFNAMIK